MFSKYSLSILLALTLSIGLMAGTAPVQARESTSQNNGVLQPAPASTLPDGLQQAILEATNQPSNLSDSSKGEESAQPFYIEQKVIASDGTVFTHFGYSVALDGDTALVGTPYDHIDTINDQGSAYIFVRSETAWIQQAKLTAPDGSAWETFGYSVALSGDTALVGAPNDDVGMNNEQGSIYIFVRNGTTWNFQYKLTASDGATGDNFGWSVALDGDTALVGVFRDDTHKGAAYAFVRNGSTWMEQAKLTASDGVATDCFGYSVALDGDIALVGAVGDIYEENPSPGSAYVFIRSGTDWSEQAKLTASDGAAFDQFGNAVAIQGDTALVGARWDDIFDMENSGSAYVFVRSGTTWSQQAKLYVYDEYHSQNNHFGTSVSLSTDLALIGVPGTYVGGSAYIFVRSETTWTWKAQLNASDGEKGDRFGSSVALSDSTFLIGAYHDDSAIYEDQGSIYFFQQHETLPALTPLAPNGMFSTFTPTFEWVTYPGATSYRLAVYSISTASYLILDTIATSYCNGIQCSYPSSLALPNGDYRFKVLAYTASRTTPYSDWMYFTITCTSISPIPVSNSWNPNGVITFKWTTFPKTTSYLLAVYSLSTASYLILDTIPLSYCNASHCSYPSPIFISNGDYKFKVLAYIPGGKTPYSDWKQFTITGIPPAPILISPTGDLGTLMNPDFIWNPYPWATAYYLAVYSDSAADYMILDTVPTSYCNNDQCSYPSPLNFMNGEYRFKVLAYIPGGATPYSDWMTFSISNPWPHPLPYSPNGKLSGIMYPEFTWSTYPDATSYLLGVYSNSAAAYVILETVPTSSCTATLCTYPSPVPFANGGYKFKVLAYTSSGKTPYSYWNWFQIDLPPAPIPLSPSGGLNGVMKPDFVWSAFPSATAYRLGVYSYAASAYLILDTVPTSFCNDDQCSYPSPVSLSNGEYGFKLLAYTPSGATPYSDWKSFEIIGVVLPTPAVPPTPISPNGTVTTHRPTFQWSAVDYAAFYRLGVYSFATKTYLILENVYPACVAGVCSFTHSTIDLPNGNYRFKVLARNSSGMTPYSSYMNFTVSSNLPVAPTLLAPSGMVGANPPAFQWNAVSGATQYRLAVYSYGTGSYIIITNITPGVCSGSTCTYTPPSALTSGDYKFKMLTYNAYGISGYSPFMNFTIP